MKSFTYYTPTKVFFGREEYKRIGEIVEGYGFKKAMLHYGGGSIKKSGLFDIVASSLKEHGIEVVEFGGAQPNPTLEHATEGMKLCVKEGVDLVLAVGGGSAIDSAKTIAVGAKNDCDTWRFAMKEAEPKAALPVATILTLAATGSEMSASAVITNSELGLKRGYNSDFHRPLFSILCPELTFTLPPYQTACGIVDIMMHTLERYLTRPGDVMITDRMAEGVLTTVVDAGRRAMKNPEDYDARADLMWAGSLSHNDLTGSGRDFMMISHQFEHEMSGMFPYVAHGAGLAVVFPAWAKYVYKKNTRRFARLAELLWGITEGSDEEKAYKGILAFENFFRELGMPVRMKELNIPASAFAPMAAKCTANGTKKLNAIIDYTDKEIIEIFELADRD